MSEITPGPKRVIVALLLVLLTACQTWQPTFVSPQQLIPVEGPSSVRVTLWGGARVTLENPSVRNDSIFGFTDAGVIGLPSEDLALLEVRRLSILRSIGFGYLTLAALFFVACLAEGDDCVNPR